ncbi:hypothetical protein HPP92_024762 [Vanilla planifolia]|uniref:Uncharacterized protein n=1 Tax=Vanilla planifolia TaxID=51239 RepID=A0A835UBU4_VANPL|nr:hypothetical protein HPP92_024762 [Vanilla planifolia]
MHGGLLRTLSKELPGRVAAPPAALSLLSEGDNFVPDSPSAKSVSQQFVREYAPPAAVLSNDVRGMIL